jgi:hypothetical protein
MNMRFNLCYGNHGSGIGIEDTLIYLRNALRVAGHEAYISPYLEPRGYNIMLEQFGTEAPAEFARLRQTTEARFIIVATEFTNGRTFNTQSAATAGHYGRTQYWQTRFDTFCQAAKSAEAIWCMTEHQLDSYRELLPDMPVLMIPRGFDPLTSPPVHAPPHAKDIDLLFTGSATDYRQAILAKLSKSFRVITSSPSTPLSARLDLISRTKANLHINLVANAHYTSVNRHHFVINNKGTMLSERALFPGELDDFIVGLDSDTLIDEVADFMTSGRWKTAGEEAYERYKLERPIEEAMAGFIAASLQSPAAVTAAWTQERTGLIRD